MSRIYSRICQPLQWTVQLMSTILNLRAYNAQILSYLIALFSNFVLKSFWMHITFYYTNCRKCLYWIIGKWDSTISIFSLRPTQFLIKKLSKKHQLTCEYIRYQFSFCRVLKKLCFSRHTKSFYYFFDH